IGVSGGVSYGPLGGTHTSLHDIASMRALPNIEVFIPSDGCQTRAITNYMAEKKGPVYMRTGRGDVPQVYMQNEKFDIKKAKILQNGTDVTIIACGEMVHYAKLAGEQLSQQGISARVIDMFCIKPADESAVYAAVRETKGIVTVEEHSVHGGLGELVAHLASQCGGAKVMIMGFPDEEYKVGKSSELFECYGLTAENIAATAKTLLEEM
ncbi:MAG: transketolase C-terminal domain-containing protein, partial [Christensenella sp.]